MSSSTWTCPSSAAWLFRNGSPGFRLPVVVITGSDSAATHARALVAGASAYLAKPVDGQTLLDAIAAAISRQPAPVSSAEDPAVNRHHPESEEHDDRQPGNNG